MNPSNDSDKVPLLETTEKEEKQEFNKSESAGPPPYTVAAASDIEPLLNGLESQPHQYQGLDRSNSSSHCLFVRLFGRRCGATGENKCSYKRAFLFIFCASMVSAFVSSLITVIYFKPHSIKAYIEGKKTLSITSVSLRSEANGETISDVKASVRFSPSHNVNPVAWSRLGGWLDSRITVEESEYDLFLSTPDSDQRIAKLHIGAFQPSFESQESVIHFSNIGVKTIMVDNKVLSQLVNQLTNDMEHLKPWKVNIMGSPKTSFGWFGWKSKLVVEMSLTPADLLDNLSKYNFKIDETEFQDDSGNTKYVTLKVKSSFINPYPFTVNSPVFVNVPIFDVPHSMEKPCDALLKPVAFLVAPNNQKLDVRSGENKLPLDINIPISQIGHVFKLMSRYQHGESVQLRFGGGAHLVNSVSKAHQTIDFCFVDKVQKSAVYDQILTTFNAQRADLMNHYQNQVADISDAHSAYDISMPCDGDDDGEVHSEHLYSNSHKIILPGKAQDEDPCDDAPDADASAAEHFMHSMHHVMENISHRLHSFGSTLKDMLNGHTESSSDSDSNSSDLKASLLGGIPIPGLTGFPGFPEGGFKTESVSVEVDANGQAHVTKEITVDSNEVPRFPFPGLINKGSLFPNNSGSPVSVPQVEEISVEIDGNGFPHVVHEQPASQIEEITVEIDANGMPHVTQENHKSNVEEITLEIDGSGVPHIIQNEEIQVTPQVEEISVEIDSKGSPHVVRGTHQENSPPIEVEAITVEVDKNGQPHVVDARPILI